MNNLQVGAVIQKARAITEKIRASVWGSLPPGAAVEGKAVRRATEREIDLLDSKDPHTPDVRRILEDVRAGAHDEDCAGYVAGKMTLSSACTCPAGKRYSQ